MTRFVGVFQHYAREAGELRAAILDVLNRAMNRTDEDKYPKLQDTKSTIIDGYFAKIRSRLLPLLYYGSFNLTKTRTLGYELTWKWTEATGKFVGCSYWSVQAKALFDREMRSRHATLTDAWRLSKDLQSGKGRHGINHEHVFPIFNVRQILGNPSRFPKSTCDIPALKRFFERQVVGCVVLEGEHREVDGLPGTDDNPWLRYRHSSIKLVPNPAWSDLHARLIAGAGLLA
jgi:hypothetical protein